MIDLDSLDNNDTFSSWPSLPSQSVKDTIWNGREVICVNSNSFFPRVTKVLSHQNWNINSNKQTCGKDTQVHKIDPPLKTPTSAEGPAAPNGTILGGILIISGAVVWCFSPPAGMNLIRMGVGSILVAEGENLVGKVKKN